MFFWLGLLFFIAVKYPSEVLADEELMAGVVSHLVHGIDANRQLLAVKIIAQLLFSGDSGRDVAIGRIVELANVGATAEIRSASLLVMQNYIDGGDSVRTIVGIGGLDVIIDALESGLFQMKHAAAAVLGNLLAMADPAEIEAAVAAGVVGHMVECLAVDDEDCLVTVAKGFIQLLHVADQTGTMAEVWERFAADGGIDRIRALNENASQELAGLLAVLWDSFRAVVPQVEAHKN
jgi:hypothetical protein